MRNFLSIGVILFMVVPSCLAMNMWLSSTCGIPTKYLQVEVSGSGGGYATVNENKTINFTGLTVKEGTLLSAVTKLNCNNPNCDKLFGPWTVAKDYSKLPVQCIEFQNPPAPPFAPSSPSL